MKKNIVNRGGKLHIQTTFEGRRVRFSTKLKDTKENREYVLREYERLINKHLMPKEKPSPLVKESLQNYIAKILKRKEMVLKPNSIKSYNYFYQKIKEQ